MEFALVIYLISMLSNLGIMLGVMTFVTFVAVLFYLIWYSTEGTSIYRREKHKFRTWPVYLAVVLGVFTTVIPSEKTMYMMVGSYAAQKVVESKMAKDVVKIIELKLEEELEKATKSKSKE